MPFTVVATNPPVRAALLIALACLASLAGTALAAQPSQVEEPPAESENPCFGPDSAQLRCPDLVMRRPWGLYKDKRTKPGRTLLRAGNVIDSVGDGPAELYGRRIGPRFMRARQRIYTRDGGWIGVATNGRLQFKFAHLDRFWWKFYNAARFQLWRVNSDGRHTRLVRTGPKVAYCLRDLERTQPQLLRSPRRRHYPACSNDARAQSVTLGTSVGWADIYPPTYPEQWIDVTGLRGCFAYVHIADPNNKIWELDEVNNAAQVIVRLPFRQKDRRGGCPGPDRGVRYGRSPYEPY
jgi:lysyl oxidase